jgi:DNA polymerase I-like protein with 3'-5' exonuclease and polymerase domains
LINYSNYKGHGLDEIGKSLGKPKTYFKKFSEYSEEMLEYCKDDVDLGERIFNLYRRFIDDPSWEKSLACEHKMAFLCEQMHWNGFKFDIERARRVLPEIQHRMMELEAEFQDIWPPKLVEVNRVQYKTKGDGTLYRTVTKARENYPKTEVDSEANELVCYDYRSFNPASTPDRIEKLWEAGWKPTEKTKTHFKFLTRAKPGEKWGKTVLDKEAFEKKKRDFEYSGWTVSEENLQTLPQDAPEGAFKLAEWLTLQGRMAALRERIKECESDGRIRTKFWHIGAWTHRMSHSNPNLANISSPFHGEPRNAVEEVKKKYDTSFREMFTVDDGGYLVGTDAESIQLRILSHYLKNEEYVHAITSGRKEDKTDIHNVNLKALGLEHLTRDDAKTFNL